MLDEVRNDPELAGAAKKLLLLADVRDELPTPIARLITAAGLSEPAESLLSDESIDQAPSHLVEVMKGLSGKVMALLDRRENEVHIRPEHASNGAFKRLHEVGHHIIPCQSELAYADDYYTLSAEASALFELQANHVAAELLFQQGLLEDHAASSRLRVKSVLELAGTFGATIHSTFRRYVESNHKAVAGVVLVRQPVCCAPLSFERREAFSSQTWRQRFHDPRAWPGTFDSGPFAAVVPHVAAVDALVEAGSYQDPVRARIAWPDLNGELRTMKIEVFTNTYNVFVMFSPSRARVLLPKS